MRNNSSVSVRVRPEVQKIRTGFSWDRVKIELDKCILVCSNCHREIHDGMVKLENVNASVTTTIF